MSCALFLRSRFRVRWETTVRQLRKAGEDYDIIHTFHSPLPHSACVCVCVSWCLSACLSVHPMFVSLCAFMSVPVCVYVPSSLCACVSVPACVCVCARVCVFLFVFCLCVCVWYLCLCICVCVCFFAVCLCQSLKFCIYLCLLLLWIWHGISISFLLIICIIFNEAFTYNVFDTTYKRATCSSTFYALRSSECRRVCV